MYTVRPFDKKPAMAYLPDQGPPMGTGRGHKPYFWRLPQHCLNMVSTLSQDCLNTLNLVSIWSQHFLNSVSTQSQRVSQHVPNAHVEKLRASRETLPGWSECGTHRPQHGESHAKWSIPALNTHVYLLHAQPR